MNTTTDVKTIEAETDVPIILLLELKEAQKGRSQDDKLKYSDHTNHENHSDAGYGVWSNVA